MPSAAARRTAGILLLGLALSGCAAATTAVAKRNLDVQTRMTDTIFLDPVAPGRAHGLCRRPQHLRPARPRHRPAGPRRRSRRAATAWSTTRATPASSSRPTCSRPAAARRPRREAASGDGFGGTLLGGAAGGAAGYGLGAAGIGVNNTVGAIGGALAGAAIAGLADAYVQDTTYTIVTDIQVSERAPTGVVVSQSEQANLSQGTSGTISQSSSRDHRRQALPHPDGQHRQPGQPRLGGGRAANWSPA